MLNAAKPARDIIHLVARAVKKYIVHLVRELLDRGVYIKSKSLGDRHKERPVPALLLDGLKSVDRDRALAKRESSVGDKSVYRDPAHLSKSVAVWARTLRVVEGKHSRLKLAKRDIMLLAGIAL